MPGPPPNPNARRRNARQPFVTLPSEGREGDPPAWPIGKGSKAVLELWAELWCTPQAVQWERLGWVRVVARYTKLVVAAERASASSALLGEVRQLEDRLGLNPKAMKSLGWLVADPVVESAVPAEVTNLDDFRELYG